MSSKRIDVHAHMIPPFWAAMLDAKGGQPSWGTPEWSPEAAIALMDRLEVQTAILSLSAPALLSLDGAERTEMGRRVNDYGGELTRQHPGRFGFYVTPQLPDVKGACDEIARGMDELGADGVVLLSNYHGTYLGDPAFAPMWDELERRKAVVYIHPSDPKMAPIPGIPGPVIDFPMDTTRTAISLVAGRVTERCGSVRIILSHAGGFLPYAATRFAVLLHAYALKDKSEEALTAELRTFYFDTALSTPNALPSLLAFAAPGHVVFGSDNPYVPPGVLARFTRELDEYAGFKPNQLDSINRGTCEALFPRLRAMG